MQTLEKRRQTQETETAKTQCGEDTSPQIEGCRGRANAARHHGLITPTERFQDEKMGERKMKSRIDFLFPNFSFQLPSYFPVVHFPVSCCLSSENIQAHRIRRSSCRPSQICRGFPSLLGHQPLHETFDVRFADRQGLVGSGAVEIVDVPIGDAIRPGGKLLRHHRVVFGFLQGNDQLASSRSTSESWRGNRILSKGTSRAVSL